MLKLKTCAALVGVVLALGASVALAADPETQAQIDAIKAVIPKFAIPMREVGDRYQDMYFAAKGGNWALAAYMSKYMNGAMTPASLTKPAEYKDWRVFYDKDFVPVNKAIQAAYTKTIDTCNECHKFMEYGFIKVVKQANPSDNGIDYTKKSEPGDVPK